ncbi:MAG: hypothetical protein ACRD1V_15805 [Vicinamibacterales bacterium]
MAKIPPSSAAPARICCRIRVSPTRSPSAGTGRATSSRARRGATSEGRLVGVSRSGFSAEGLDVLLDPETILNAFPA